MQRILVLFICLVILTSCDPFRRINMKNQTSQEAEITWSIKMDSILSSPFYISSSTDIKFKLEPGKPYNFVNMSFGIGTWTPKAIRNLVDDLDSMVIKWKGQEIILDTEEEIGNYLMARRKGIGREKIWIVLRD